MADAKQYSGIASILKTYTGSYVNRQVYGNIAPYINPSKPIFAKFWIPIMLTDPHIWYGMEILKGPIVSKAKYLVEADDPEVAEYVDRQIKNFWKNGIVNALECLSYGYAASEVIYEYNAFEGCVDYKELKYFFPRDVKAVTQEGKMVGVEISNIRGCTNPKYLSAKKILWSINDKKYNRWYGRSRLQGAFGPWWEMDQPKGYKSIRHLWFYRQAFSGGVLYYPDGTTQDPETGEDISNALIAQELLDRKETGSSLALPNKTGDTRDWEWEDGKSNAIPEGLLDYGDVLRDEVWEGLGVPPEVAKSEDSGSFAGRRVPQQAFYSNSQELADLRMEEFVQQVVKDVLIPLKFGMPMNFTVTPISIIETLQQEEMGLVTGKLPGDGAAPGEESGAFGEEEPELDEDGNPIEEDEMNENGENTPFGAPSKLDDGRIEDRNTNAFNIKESVQKKSKKKQKPPKFGGK